MLLAMFALVVWTFLVMLLVLTTRFRSVFNRDVSPKYYRLMSGGQAPDYVVKPAKQLSNLFETPVLFYVAGALFVALDIQSAFVVGLAWVYVALRVMHACIHITYNNVIHRLTVFVLSTLCVLTLWVMLIFRV